MKIIIICLPRAIADQQVTKESIQRMHAPCWGPSRCPPRHYQRRRVFLYIHPTQRRLAATDANEKAPSRAPDGPAMAVRHPAQLLPAALPPASQAALPCTCGEVVPSNKDLFRTTKRIVKLVGKDLQRRACHVIDARMEAVRRVCISAQVRRRHVHNCRY